ncbi:MAG: FG-GAP repeat protein [Arcicella sp.]|jgi:hypothetical protein|nr:FG-GAP repeat protein [Arcicella sp.]
MILTLLLLFQSAQFLVGDGVVKNKTLRIEILKNNQKFQTIVMEYYTEDKFSKTTDVVWGDFNFDGQTDVALSDGNQGSYGAKSYEIYVFNITKQQFVLSKELSEIAHNSAGMFEYFPKTKTIKTYDKENAHTMRYQTYKVVFGKGLKLINEKMVRSKN